MYVCVFCIWRTYLYWVHLRSKSTSYRSHLLLPSLPLSLTLSLLSHSLSRPLVLSLSYGTHRPLPTSWFRSLSHRLKPISFDFIPFVFTFLFSYSLFHLFTLIHTHTHTHTLTHTHTYLRAHAHPSLTPDIKHTLTCSNPKYFLLGPHLSFSPFWLFTHTRTHAHPHTHMYTHIYTHARCHSHFLNLSAGVRKTIAWQNLVLVICEGLRGQTYFSISSFLLQSIHLKKKKHRDKNLERILIKTFVSSQNIDLEIYWSCWKFIPCNCVT